MTAAPEQAQVTLITGASSGIGLALARVFAHHGHHLVLVARRGDRLEMLAESLVGISPSHPRTLALDLANPGAADHLADRLSAWGVTVAILVNNAGFGLIGRAAERERAETLGMVDLNIRVLTDLTLRFLPDLIRTKGRILNVASLAGFTPGPGMAVYYASKAYVVSFSAALGAELKGSGVTVTALCPGLTPTEFQARAGGMEGMSAVVPQTSAATVAEAGYSALMVGRSRVVPGVFNRLGYALLHGLPRFLVMPVLLRAQARRRSS